MRSPREAVSAAPERIAPRQTPGRSRTRLPGLLDLQRRVGNRAVAFLVGGGPHRLDPRDEEVEGALATTGRPLDPRTRAEMEASFGHDFSAVRVHDDARSAETAAGIDAAAFTVGQDIVFGAGRYAPGTHRGRELLAHELAHTVQQRGARARSPASAPGSRLERSAAAAGSAAARGERVTRSLGRSGLAVARQMIGNENQWVPENLHDKALEDEFAALWARLRQKHPYPERGRDLVRLEELKGRAHRELEERKAAVAEAEALVAQSDQDDKDDDAPPPPRKAARPAKQPSKFSPGGFTDEDIYRDYNAMKARLDRELAPPKDKRKFDARLKAARAKTPPTLLPADFPEAVWSYGRGEGLFAEYEERLVKETLTAPARKRAAEQTKRDKMQAAYQQQLRHEQAIQQIQIAPFQAPAVAAFGEVAAGAYLLYGGADTVIQFNRAMKSGSTTDAVGAVLPFVAGAATHYTIQKYGGGYGRGGGGRGFPGEELAPTPVARTGPQEVGPDVVRAAYRANPHAVQQSGGDDWHQFQWERAGGTGKAPIAFEVDGMIRVHAVRWLAVGDIAEITSAADLNPSAAPAKAQPPLAYAKTGVPGDPGQTPGTPPPMPRAAPPAARPAPAPAPPGAAPRGYPAVPPEVAGEAYSRNPNVIVHSGSHDFHRMVWNYGGGVGEPPLAFKVGNRIRIDVERWPTDKLGDVGISMRLPQR